MRRRVVLSFVLVAVASYVLGYLTARRSPAAPRTREPESVSANVFDAAGNRIDVRFTVTATYTDKEHQPPFGPTEPTVTLWFPGSGDTVRGVTYRSRPDLKP